MSEVAPTIFQVCQLDPHRTLHSARQPFPALIAQRAHYSEQSWSVNAGELGVMEQTREYLLRVLGSCR